MSEGLESLTPDDDLADANERTHYDLVPIDWSRLASPTVLRALVGIAIGLAVLGWPDRTDRALGRLVGIALIWLAGTSLQTAVRRQPRQWLTAAEAIAGLAAGLFLVLAPDRSATFLGRLVGVAALVVAMRTVIVARRHDRDRTWIAPAVALTAAGALMLAAPEQMVTLATRLAAVVLIAISVVVVVASLDERRGGATGYVGTIERAGVWLSDRPKSVDARQALYDKILFDGPGARHRLIRFFTLMAFAGIIAAMGVVTDSTAVVIGAMLIAPLMTPLMGMAISLVMGWPNRLTRSAVVAFAGIALAIAIGIILGTISPAVINPATNAQILSRTNPTVLDLTTALAAGAAGAYGLSRPDVSDSLPGVAIAISLVPPLSVVGISYSQGAWSAGHGALLLFMTNMLAILIMGGVTFVVTGVTPLVRVAESQLRLRTSLAAVSLAAVIVLAGLFLNGTRSATNLFEQSETEATVDHWLVEAELHRLVSVSIDGDKVLAVVVGPSDGLGRPEDLAADLTSSLGRPVEVDIRLIVEERLSSTGT